MASAGGPEAEFHDPRRQQLLQALNDALCADIPPTAWACLWLCDIDKLEEIIAQAQAQIIYVRTFFEAIEVSARIVPTWTQRKRPASAASGSQNPSTPRQPLTPLQPSLTPLQSPLTPLQPPRTPLQPPLTPLQPPPVQQQPSTHCSRGKKRNSSGQLTPTRSKIQRDLCHQRDQKKCVLTKSGVPNEVAHIYPFSMRYEDNTIQQRGLSFWETLRMFWSKERVDAWYNAIFRQGTEVCQNLICLALHAHGYWERAYFALKPVRLSDDKKCLDVQFFWLSSNSHVTDANVLNVPSLLTNSDQGPNLARLWNHETGTEIRSGCKISLETDDPVLRPLPDFRLLEMQWFLHRVTAMSGAAEPQDDSHDDSDEDYNENVEEALNWRHRYREYDREYMWDMDIEEGPATNLETSAGLFWEEHFPAQLPGSQIPLRGGGFPEEVEPEGEDPEAENCEGKDHKYF